MPLRCGTTFHLYHCNVDDTVVRPAAIPDSGIRHGAPDRRADASAAGRRELERIRHADEPPALGAWVLPAAGRIDDARADPRLTHRRALERRHEDAARGRDRELDDDAPGERRLS